MAATNLRWRRRFRSVRNSLSPEWAIVFVVEHDESQSWTNLRINVRHSRESARGRGNASSLAHRGVGPEDKGSPYRIDDPTMGEASVEVGGVLRREGQVEELELEEGGR